jgi:hypothetical protein
VDNRTGGCRACLNIKKTIPPASVPAVFVCNQAKNKYGHRTKTDQQFYFAIFHISPKLNMKLVFSAQKQRRFPETSHKIQTSYVKS